MYIIDGKMGIRDRRSDGIYLFWEIVSDIYGENDKFMHIYRFCKDRFYRKSMKERKYFGVWIGMFVVNYDRKMW